MRRTLFVLLLMLMKFQTSVDAAPFEQDCSGVAISSPQSGDAVRGRISVTGSAAIPQFQFYKVEMAPGASPPDSAFRNLGPDVHRTAVQSGVLEAWETAGVPDGTYSLRLTVVDQRGNFPCPPVTVRIVVSNRAPANTPTPDSTETPTPGPTGSPSPQASSNANQPAAPTIALPTSAARSTDTITSTSGLSGTIGTARQLLNLDFLPEVGVACVLGAVTMGAVFALFGVFTVARWVMDQI